MAAEKYVDLAINADHEHDYDKMLACCSKAMRIYKQRGINDLMAVFDIANILANQRHYAEAAYFYKMAFDMHSKAANQFPSAHMLLMARLVSLLKGNFLIKEEELALLKSLCIPLYNFIVGWRLYREQNDPVAAIQIMKNCYEEFHTGEEADTVYLTIMMDIFNPSPEICKKTRSVGDADFNVIPNNLFLYWDEDPPKEVQDNFAYYKQMEHFQVKTFDKAEATEWLYQNYGVEARQLFLSARHPAEAADFFRVHAMNYYGGWWMDADLQIRSFERFYSIIPSVYEHVFCLTDQNVIYNGFFGSIANSPILNDCMLSLYRNSYLHGGLFIAYKTGPGIFARAVNRNYYRAFRGEGKIPSCVFLDQHRFDQLIKECQAPYKVDRVNWMGV